ncbi:GapR family DNA-binding domain-containing protein [Methylobacterium sp. NPDC080182]|uniref:GapR family DNA-binding domain-containing protein n=1 Tax=Methylobacterium sp. NPDC080182 TaxID=3390590 RepID=UPI003D03DECF
MESPVAGQRLASFIDRILTVHREQDELNGVKKEIYAEAAGEGFDKTAMGALVRELRKAEKDSGKAAEQAELLDLYRDSYHRAASHVGAHIREAAE